MILPLISLPVLGCDALGTSSTSGRRLWWNCTVLTTSNKSRLFPSAASTALLISSAFGRVSRTNTVTPSPVIDCRLLGSSGKVIGNSPGDEGQATSPGTGIGGVRGQPTGLGPVAPISQTGEAATIGTSFFCSSFRLLLINLTRSTTDEAGRGIPCSWLPPLSSAA